jgi:vacuolar-type H+-ATPase subunit H
MGQTPPAGDLARLLETEQRLEERLRAARADGEAIIAQAHAEAARREADVESALRTEAQRLDDQFEAERRRREEEIQAEARVAVGRYERISAGRIADVVAQLGRRLAAGETA